MREAAVIVNNLQLHGIAKESPNESKSAKQL